MCRADWHSPYRILFIFRTAMLSLWDRIQGHMSVTFLSHVIEGKTYKDLFQLAWTELPLVDTTTFSLTVRSSPLMADFSLALVNYDFHHSQKGEENEDEAIIKLIVLFIFLNITSLPFENETLLCLAVPQDPGSRTSWPGGSAAVM